MSLITPIFDWQRIWTEDPIERDHPLCPDLFYLVLPQFAGGRILDNLMGGNHGTLTSQTSWSNQSENSYGSLNFAAAGAKVSVGRAVADVPMTLTCGFNPTVSGTFQTLLTIGSTSAQTYNTLRLNSADVVQAISSVTGSSATANTSSSVTVGKWHHGAAVFATSNDRRVFLDGRSKSTNSTSRVVTGTNDTVIGTRADSTSNQFTGLVSYAAVFRLALSDEEVYRFYEEAARSFPTLIRRRTNRSYLLVQTGTIPAEAYGEVTGIGSITSIGTRQSRSEFVIHASTSIQSEGYRVSSSFFEITSITQIDSEGYSQRQSTADVSALSDIFSEGYRTSNSSSEVTSAEVIESEGYRVSVALGIITGSSTIESVGESPDIIPTIPPSEAYFEVEGNAQIDGIGYRQSLSDANILSSGDIVSEGYRTSQGYGDISGLSIITSVGKSPGLLAEAYGEITATANISSEGYRQSSGYFEISAITEIDSFGYRYPSSKGNVSAVSSLSSVGYRLSVGQGNITGNAIIYGVGYRFVQTTPNIILTARDRTGIVLSASNRNMITLGVSNTSIGVQ